MNVAQQVMELARAQRRKTLSEHESKVILMSYGIPVTQEILVTMQVDLERSLAELPFPYPIVMKVDSPDILHKTEVGVVKLNVRNPDEALVSYTVLLEKAYQYNPAAHINGILLQEKVQGTVAECIVGLTYDIQFGPTVMYGSGGILVEVLEDVSLRLPPFDQDEAFKMLQETKGYKLLQGFRGQPPADIEALVILLTTMSSLATDLGDMIAEIDINPVLVLRQGQGLKAVDALIRLQ